MTRLSLTFFSLFLVRNVDPLKQKQTCLYSVKRKKEKAGKKGEKKTSVSILVSFLLLHSQEQHASYFSHKLLIYRLSF